MWAKITHIHPSQRRFRTAISLGGKLLTQEIAGIQTREVVAYGCTHEEYAKVVRESEASGFLEGQQHSAADQINPGINSFQVSGNGQRKLPVGTVADGSYSFQSNC